MGICTSRPPPRPNPYSPRDPIDQTAPTQTPISEQQEPTPQRKDDVISATQSPFFPFYSPSPAHFFKKENRASPSPPGTKSATSTPGRFFRRPLPPPSPAKHIRAFLARRQGKKSTATTGASTIPEEGEGESAVVLDRRFGFSKEFTSRLEVGEEVGRGHFGYTCSARFKKGEFKGKEVAVKVISKAKECKSRYFLDARDVTVLLITFSHIKALSDPLLWVTVLHGSLKYDLCYPLESSMISSNFSYAEGW